MKISTYLNIITLLLCLACLNACKSIDLNEPSKVSPVVVTQNSEDKVIIEKIQNNPGVSSTTVERLAIQNQCDPIEIINLLTPKGPVEIYRATCANGKIFMAKCELRQCAIMPSKE